MEAGMYQDTPCKNYSMNTSITVIFMLPDGVGYYKNDKGCV